MSGGFFRGTSAEQDTRFSNKQAKLLKTQKFAPELEHLVDITKVKMDVIKPWIAKRVTELLDGFEDEVLINFIHGLLEGKVVNGKEVQIQLTGFMEKNTGKFMKELWALLLSAQKNASGVPQQFLDAKEEETRNRKAETDRIFTEIQRRKERENKESEQEKVGKMDGGLDNNSAGESNRRQGRGFDAQSGDENGADVRNGFGGRTRASKSPYSSDHSPSHRRSARSRSISKSYSNSRSDSKERSMSRSISGSPRASKRSVSAERRHRSPVRSVTPRRRSARESISPRRRSHSRRRSSSHTPYRSPSPVRRRVHSPLRRRSSSPPQHRSPSPVRRRSPAPLRRRPRSPLRRRSPWRRRSPSPRRQKSPSPVRRRRRRSTSSPKSRSPVRRRSPSPVRRRFQSPVRRRSPYPVRRRSPSPDRRRSPSPRGRRPQSPVRRRSSPLVRRRSPLPARRRSPTPSPSRSPSPGSRSPASPVRHSSASPVKMRSPGLQESPHGYPKEKIRNHEPAVGARRQPISLSPQRDHSDRNRSRRKMPSVSPSPKKSPSFIEPSQTRTRNSHEDRRLASPFDSPGNRAGSQMTLNDSRSPLTKLRDQRVFRGSLGRSDERLENAREHEENKHKSSERSLGSSGAKKRESPEQPASHQLHGSIDSRRKNNEMPSEEVSLKEVRALKKPPRRDSVSDEKPDIVYPGDASKSDDKRISHSKDARDNSRSDSLVNSHKKRGSPDVDSDSRAEGRDEHRAAVAEKRKHRKSSRREAASDETSSESDVEDRKEAKRRRKEEKKLRKEERRRRREERRRRREEKRASKRKRKSKEVDVLSSDVDKTENDANASNGDRMKRKYSSEEEDTESQKKRLEIELREKALESLRAKKGVGR